METTTTTKPIDDLIGERPQGRRVRVRARAMVALFAVLMVIGSAWIFEINVFLSSMRGLESIQVRMQQSLRKQCAHLNHRDEDFITDDNKHVCLSDQEVEAVIRDVVFTAADAFSAHNVTYFLESGTLLGSYRNKGVIPRDKDADLGIDAAGLDYMRHNVVTLPDDYVFTVWNSSLYPNSTRDDKLPVRLVHLPTGLYADVFAFLDWKDEKTGEDFVGPLPSICFNGCASCEVIDGVGRHLKLPREWVFPLVDCPFEGRTLKCPRAPADYLKFMFGGDFMTPW